MGYGENGLVIYSDGSKKLYALVINNINEQTGMVYFKSQPAYKFFFDGKLKLMKIDKSPASGFRISKLPGFVNRPKKETGQMEIPGWEKKIKKPKGGYPALFNVTKDITDISKLGSSKEFDDWIFANNAKYDLTPPQKLAEPLLKEITKEILKAKMTPEHIKYWALFANFNDLFKDVHTLDNLDKVYNLGMKKLSHHKLAKNAFEYFYNYRKEQLLK